MVRRIIMIGILVFSQFSQALSYTLEITEQELQEKVSAMMPMEKKKFFVTVIVSNPQVDLIEESNEIGVFVNIEAIAPGGVKGAGSAKIIGTLSYDKEKGAFYLNNPKIISMDINKMPEKISPKIQQVSQLALTKALSKYPVYKFKDDNLKHKLAKATLESIEVKNEKLLVTLGIF